MSHRPVLNAGLGEMRRARRYIGIYIGGITAILIATSLVVGAIILVNKDQYNPPQPNPYAILSAPTHLEILGEVLPCLTEGATCAQFEDAKKYVQEMTNGGEIAFTITGRTGATANGTFTPKGASDPQWVAFGSTVTLDGNITQFRAAKAATAGTLGEESATAVATTPDAETMVIAATFKRENAAETPVWLRFEVAPQ